MSRITRRTFLQTCTTIASATVLGACTWANPTITSTFGQTQLTIWSTPGSIDQALARWRRLNPSINLRRQVFETHDLATNIQQLPMRTDDTPDIIVTDNFTIIALQNTDGWRHVDAATTNAGMLPAAINQTRIDERRLFGVPLTINPLKIWYQSEILRDALGLTDTTQVQSAIGDNWLTFETFIQQLHRSNPTITTLSSYFDDLSYPLAIDAIQQQRPIADAFITSFGMAQQHIVGRAVHFGGKWFDLLKRNSVALIVGGRGLGSAISRTWVNDARSPWRTVQHPLGALYGPSMVAVIPIRAVHYEQATQLIHDFVNDSDLQILISNESGSLPALASAYDHAELQKIDAIQPMGTIRDIWRTQLSASTLVIQPESVVQLQRYKHAFYAWQRGDLTDAEINRLIEQTLSSVP